MGESDDCLRGLPISRQQLAQIRPFSLLSLSLSLSRAAERRATQWPKSASTMHELCALLLVQLHGKQSRTTPTRIIQLVSCKFFALPSLVSTPFHSVRSSNCLLPRFRATNRNKKKVSIQKRERTRERPQLSSCTGEACAPEVRHRRRRSITRRFCVHSRPAFNFHPDASKRDAPTAPSLPHWMLKLKLKSSLNGGTLKGRQPVAAANRCARGKIKN